MKVSGHALLRYMQRSGRTVKDAAENKLKELVKLAHPVELKPEFRARALIRNNFKIAQYKQFNDWYFVLDETGSVLITVYTANETRWLNDKTTQRKA